MALVSIIAHKDATIRLSAMIAAILLAILGATSIPLRDNQQPGEVGRTAAKPIHSAIAANVDEFLDRQPIASPAPSS